MSSHDAVALTVGGVDFVTIAGVEFPRVRVLDRYSWTGVPHPALYATLSDLLERVWCVDHVTVDATGVGAGVASFLEDALGAHRVERVTFDGAWALHSDLAYAWLAAINSGRFLEYAEDGDELTAAAWREYRLARVAARPGQRIKLHVEDREGHDDLLVSAMLCGRAARSVHGPAASTAVILPDPLAAIDREGF